MTTLKFTVAFLSIALCSCGQGTTRDKIDPAAVELNNQAMTLVAYLDNADSSKKAITLLDKATMIDTNYFLGYHNKLIFLNQLKQLDKAVLTVNKLIQLRPNAHDLYITGGMFYERLGDSTLSKAYFEKSLAICNSVLVSMQSDNRDYEMLVGNKAVNLIMLGDTSKAIETLTSLYNIQKDEELKTMTKALMHKNKNEILDQFTGDQYSR